MLHNTESKNDTNIPMNETISSDEDITNFMTEYTANIRQISSITMMKNMGEIEEDLLEADVCWMLTDNIRGILSSNDVIQEMESNNHKEIIPFLKEHLSQNRLIIVVQDHCSWDHWFCLIGHGDKVHLVEKSPSCFNFVETFTLEGISSEIKSILKGTKPDRFYGIRGSHMLNMWVHSRGLLCKETVQEYLKFSY